ncbi:MAG: sigma 54-interacting transcriptional regulator [Myxococcota bacterium]|nr:sigma 54-interacting transcriptional regulator [Myxococcota bacterium]
MVQNLHALSGTARQEFRSREISHLREKLSANFGSTSLLYGPRGVGKTKISTALIRFAKQQPGSVVFESRARASGTSGFEVWEDIVRQAIHWAEIIGLEIPSIEKLVNDLGVLQLHASCENIEPSLEQKLRFFDSVLSLLSEIAQNARLLLVVHDLEKASGDALELAQFLSDNLFDDPRLQLNDCNPGLLLYTLASTKANSHFADDFVSYLDAHANADVLKLEGFDREALKNYLQSEHVLNKFLSASDGLPHQIDELLEGLPANVETLFERRLNSLAENERKIASSLAIYRRPANAQLLASATGLDLKIVATGLRTLLDERILDRQIENGEFKFSYSRSSNRESAINCLSLEERSKYHCGWANALMDLGEVNTSSLQAYHWFHTDSPNRGVPLAVASAEAQAVSGAFQAATVLLSSALPHAHDKQKEIILTRLIELCSLRGQLKSAEKYIIALKKLIPSQHHGPILLNEAKTMNLAGRFSDAVQCLEQSYKYELAPTDMVQRQAALAEANYQLGLLEEAKEAGEEGLKILEQYAVDSSAHRNVELVNLLGKIALAEEEYNYAIELFEQTLHLAQEKGIAHCEARALVNLGVSFVRLGNQTSAEKYLKEGVRVARSGNHLERVAFGSMNLGVMYHQRGRLSQALEYYTECKNLFRRLGNQTQLARVMYNLALLFRAIGDIKRAKAYNEEAAKLAKKCNVEKLQILSKVLWIRLFSDTGSTNEACHRFEVFAENRQNLRSEIHTVFTLEYAQTLCEAGRYEFAINEICDNLLHDSSPLRAEPKSSHFARAQLIMGRCLSALTRQGAEKYLFSAAQSAKLLNESILARDVEIALIENFLRTGKKKEAKAHIIRLVQLHESLLKGLPQAVRKNAKESPFETKIQELQFGLSHAANSSSVPALPARTRPATTKRPSSHIPASIEQVNKWERKYGDIVGSSAKLHKIFRIVDRIAQSDNAVLITGESGTGKELIAEAIHKNSDRKNGPFIKLNCGALVETLLLSELFGHERGAFTGAHQRKIGRFEMASGGTLFLDEIGDVSPKTQVALLRILQEYEFERVGGAKTIKLNARVIFATNRNLTTMVRDGTFREDLYYRLKGLNIELPPLRDRPEDIEKLALYFLKKNTGPRSDVKGLSNDALELLHRYRWPGNIRELENVIRSIALYTDHRSIQANDLLEYEELFEERLYGDCYDVETGPPKVSRNISEATPIGEKSFSDTGSSVVGEVEFFAPPQKAADEQSMNGDALSDIFAHGMSLADFKKKLQDDAIIRAISLAEGNITRAAQLLGMKRPRLSQIINADEALKAMCQQGGLK